MRATHVALSLAVLLSASGAMAQSFGNRGIGISTGFTKIQSDVEPIKWAVPIWLEGSYYIENGFEVYARVPLMLAYSSVGVTNGGTGPGIVAGTGGQVGARYLFMEEAIRPYLGLHLSGIYFFRDSALGPNFQFGPGVNAGVEFFVADSISLGARGFFDLFIVLNAPIRFAFGGVITATTYF